MTTRMLRRGLPRVPGGEPWPPELEVEVAEVEVAEVQVAEVRGVEPAPVAEPVEASQTSPGTARIRRGLPRVPGGAAWPPAGDIAASAIPTPLPIDVSPRDESPAAAAAAAATSAAAAAATGAATATGESAAPVVPAESASVDHTSIRRGLPREAGGEPWPPADTAPTVADASTGSRAENASAAGAQVASAGAEGASAGAEGAATQDVAASEAREVAVQAPAAILAPSLDTPLPWTRTVWSGRAPRTVPPAAASARRRPTWPQAIAGLMGAAALGVLAGAAIALVRTLLSTPFMQDFLAAFPGEYVSPIPVEPGFAPWVNWAHFFNAFLMVLIIRSGLRVRSEKRPTAFWTPRNKPKGKISLTLWFHQALDILWLANGVIFVVLLIVTGHWVRIVPTSWEVFPNALSAALQYLSFDWPHENGWNNYNSLQQLAYFATVFIAAPLAAITGFRMSGLWPKKAERLSKAYPVEWARALHFPVMLYFVAFIVGHVALVMLTGFLRNLNHMYASQDAVTWTGFWVFVVSLVVIAAGWFAARPLVIAPIAKVFGTVSGR